MRQIKITNRITNRETKSIEIYLNEIASTPILTAEEERDLIKRYKESKDQVALEKIIRSNLKFVISVAKNYQSTRVPLVDLISEGNVGLIKAIDRFDQSKGYKFISYAVWWIRQTILQSINDTERLIRLPANKSQMISKIKNFTDDFYKDQGLYPSNDDICEYMEISRYDLNEINQAAANHRSLNSPSSPHEEDSSCLEELIPSNFFPSPEEEILKKDIKNKAEILLNILSPREADILRASFGLLDEQGNLQQTMETIQEKYGISETRINQIRKNIIVKIRCRPGIKNLQKILE